MIPEYEKTSYAVADKLAELANVTESLDGVQKATVLSDCKDIWCRDFMPIQMDDGFRQFIYAPEYLVDDPQYWPLIAIPGASYPDWLLPMTTAVPLVLDGGSVVGNREVAFVSERAIAYNPNWNEPDLLHDLKSALNVQRVEWLPEMPHEPTGHLDGTVRVVSDTLAIVGQAPADKDPTIAAHLDGIADRVTACGFKVRRLVDVSHKAPKRPEDNCCGVYANFLQLGPRRLLVPAYGLDEDELAQRQLSDAGFEVLPIPASAFMDPVRPLAAGGSINCVTWNWKPV